MRRGLLIVAALMALAAGACGRKGTLKPLAGTPLPPIGYGQSAPATTEQGLTPPPDSQPTRIDDVIRRPERERQDDPFDLPPTGQGR